MSIHGGILPVDRSKLFATLFRKCCPCWSNKEYMVLVVNLKGNLIAALIIVDQLDSTLLTKVAIGTRNRVEWKN